MTRVLLIGASGFIGRHVAAALLAAGHDVTQARRRDIDLARAAPSEIAARLAGHGVAVNAAGLALDAAGQTMWRVHRDGTAALIAACRAAGVPRLIHFSALGAAVDGGTVFQRSKGAAEALLASAEGLDCCVLRPSLVIGRGGASTALFSALAALPVPIRLGRGAWRVQPVHIDDLTALVVRLVADEGAWPARIDVVGPRAMTTDALTAVLRGWLGLPPSRFVALPEAVLALAVRWSARRELLTMLREGNVGAPGPFAAALGRAPLALEQTLSRHPASAADRILARVTWARLLLRWSLGVFWMVVGALSLGLYPLEGSYRLLGLVGLRGGPAEIALFGGAALDLVLGALLLLRWRPVAVGGGMLAAMLMFSLIAVGLPADYWLHPFTPLLKNLPIAAAVLAMMAMEA